MANHGGGAAVGVDVSKTHLDAWRADGGAKRFGNDARGFEDFAAWVAPADALVVCESTGHYHRDFEEALAGRLRLARVNAARARRFAQALGEEAKTDAADARVLAAMGRALPLRAEVLASIPGLGPVTVAGLVVDMPELGRLDAKARRASRPPPAPAASRARASAPRFQLLPELRKGGTTASMTSKGRLDQKTACNIDTRR